MKRFIGTMLLTGLLALSAACAGAQPAAQATAAPAAQATAAPVSVGAAAAATQPPATEAPAASSAPAEVRVFQIDPAQSEARFHIDEELFGKPKNVVGTTNLVQGTINVDLADPTRTTLGPIQIDARGLTTDSGNRNRAIQRFILESGNDQYRYIAFEPTGLTGLPAAAQAGDTFKLQITGNLSVHGVTAPATFDVTITADSDKQISGLGQTTITRAAYGLKIPSVPNVANVSDNVLLELQFVATAP